MEQTCLYHKDEIPYFEYYFIFLSDPYPRILPAYFIKNKQQQQKQKFNT